MTLLGSEPPPNWVSCLFTIPGLFFYMESNDFTRLWRNDATLALCSVEVDVID